MQIYPKWYIILLSSSTRTKVRDECRHKILDIKINQINSDLNNLGTKNMLVTTKYEIKTITEDQIPISKNSSISYLLLFALGFHGLFEGISLGIQQTIRGTIFLILAISLHKWAAALTLGISFVKSGVSQKEFIIMILILWIF